MNKKTLMTIGKGLLTIATLALPLIESKISKKEQSETIVREAALAVEKALQSKTRES